VGTDGLPAPARPVRRRRAGRGGAATLGGRVHRARRCHRGRRLRAARSLAHLSESRVGPRRAALERMRAPTESRVPPSRLWKRSHTFVTRIPSESNQGGTRPLQSCRGQSPAWPVATWATETGRLL